MEIGTMLETMGSGMLKTIGIFFLTLIGSLPLGVGIMLLRTSKNKVVKNITK